MIAFQLVVQHRAAGVLTSTNFNLDALVHCNRCSKIKDEEADSGLHFDPFVEMSWFYISSDSGNYRATGPSAKAFCILKPRL
jgi:hypothetical protein